MLSLSSYERRSKADQNEFCFMLENSLICWDYSSGLVELLNVLIGLYTVFFSSESYVFSYQAG
jgi:hypothetical protein